MQAAVAVSYLLAAAFAPNQDVICADASATSAIFNARSDMTSYTDGRGKTKADGVATITRTYDGESGGGGSRAIDCEAARREPMAAGGRRLQRNATNVAQGAANIGRTFDNVGRALNRAGP